jgi:uncharacterized protein DUF4443
MALESLRQVLDSDYRGPRAFFTQVDVLKALIAIGRSGSVGRGRLATLTGLGQGEVRTLIRRLKDNDLIVIEANGCALSKKGQREYGKLSSVLLSSSKVAADRLNLGPVCWAVVVNGGAKKVRYGIEQRDAAIKAGADGAFTAIYSAGRFTVPGEGTDCEKDGPGEPWTTLRSTAVRDGDAVVVTGSSSESMSENGALAALLSLA